MVCQCACIVVAFYHGWGSSIDSIPESNLRIAETVGSSNSRQRASCNTDFDQSIFASNILLVLIHGCSRASIAITLWRACQSTPSEMFAISTFLGTVVWIIGSIVGLVVRRAVGEGFWKPVDADYSVRNLSRPSGNCAQSVLTSNGSSRCGQPYI